MEKKFQKQVEEVRKNWAKDKPLRVMFQDEARFGRISNLHSSWCPRPERPVCQVMLSQQYVYAYGAVSITDGKFESLILSGCNTEIMQIFLEEISSRHKDEKILMIMDGAGWHKSKRLTIPQNIMIQILPPYSPELNPTENIWEEIREKGFYNRFFPDLDSLEEHLLSELQRLENSPEITHSIVSWPWIINAIKIQK